MSIDDEKPITFTNEYGIEATYPIKELVGGRNTCSDYDYSNRIEKCRSCDSCVANNELCTENDQLVRVYCRLAESSCPLKKW